MEFTYEGIALHAKANLETILSTGTIQTPKLLMQSGIGDQAELQRFGIPVVQHLPGVGQNLQDHPVFGLAWEAPESVPGWSTLSQAVSFWSSKPGLGFPDVYAVLIENPFAPPPDVTGKKAPLSWAIAPAVLHPKSRGQIRLTGSKASDPLRIEANLLSHPDDMKAMVAMAKLCREIGNSAAMRPYVQRELQPEVADDVVLENFIRDRVQTCWHQAGTAKMGRDSMAVVDGQLKVHGVARLRVADGSIMPRVTTGNTMAPCVLIGEQAGELIKAAHRI